MTLLIRPFVDDDRVRLRAICRQTAAERPFLPYLDEPRLASIFFLDPYLAIEPESCFVAELDKQIVGYIVGTVDIQQFERRLEGYLRSRIGSIFFIHLTGMLKSRFRHPLSHRLIIQRYLAVVRGGERANAGIGRYIDLSLYSAHCHIQIVAEARGKRAGLSLMLRFQEHLKAKGVRGQFSTPTEEVGHESYSQMMLAMGFRTVSETTFTSQDRPSLIHPGIWRDQILVRTF